MHSLNRYPEQDDDATWLSQQATGMILHDPRVGKTPIACVAAARSGAQSIVVLTRAIAREQWRREIAKWAPGIKRVHVESYEKLSRGGRLPFRPDVLSLDEAQRCKTPKALRTKAVYGPLCTRQGGIAEGVPFLWILSGTLAPNNLGETWTHLRAYGRTDRRYVNFIERYCRVWYNAFGPQIGEPRAEHLAEYIGLIRPVSRRRRLQDIAPNLPKAIWSTLPLDMPASAAKALRDDPELADLQAKLEAETADWDAILNRAAPHLSSQRKLLGVLKAPYVADAVTDLLESGVKKVVVMAWHTEVCEILKTRLKTTLMIHGGTPERQRVAAMDAFQETDAPVIVCQIETAGEAVALHAARHIVFAESAWSLGSMIQASNRIVTPERRDHPEIIICTVPKTIDEVLAQVLQRKAQTQEVFNALSVARLEEPLAHEEILL